MEAINVESSTDVLLSNVTASSREGDFYADAKTYLTYKIGKCTYLLTVFVFQALSPFVTRKLIIIKETAVELV